MPSAEYHREWYQRNRDRLRPVKTEQGRKIRKFLRRVLDELKLILGCSECGYDKHPRALQFHHRVSRTKLFDVSDGPARAYGLSKILEEADKCEVLCANCHAIRTFSREV